GLLQHLGDQEQHAVLVFDMMGAKKLMMRKPRNLYDAWVQSIMVPLAEISKDDLEVFRFKYQPKNMDLVHISLTKHVPENHWPFVLDWSYSNLASPTSSAIGPAWRVTTKIRNCSPMVPRRIVGRVSSGEVQGSGLEPQSIGS